MIIIFDLVRTLWNPERQSVMPGAIELLTELHKRSWHLYLVTRNEIGRNETIEKTGLSKFFKKISLESDVKTVADFVNVTAIKTPWQKERMFVIGDRVKGEISIGNTCGATTVWYRQGKFANELPKTEVETPDIIIDDLLQLLSYLPDTEAI